MNPQKPVGIIPFIAIYAAAALFLPLGRGRGYEPPQEESSVDSTRIADYDIQVSLDPVQKMLDGTETITWLNAGGQPVGELKLHLYMNAFSGPDTRFFATREGWSEEEAGWIEIKSVRLPGGADLTGRIEIDETVMTLPLPEPVEAGGRIRLEIEFRVKLPRVFARTGYSKDYFLIAQWFPKMGVYADGRWICPQFHAYTEFFADFGRYRVELTVPKNYVVGATGTLESSRILGAQRRHVFTAYPVHDFAWTASPHFRKVPPEGTEITYSADGEEHRLTVQLLMQRDRLDQAPAYLEALRRAVTLFGQRYGPYPYDRLTVVDPGPGRGQNSGGMEYPMFITGGSGWLETYIFPGSRSVERVTVHEYGHQYWYGVIANNEFDEAWLDEGLNTYASDKVIDTFGALGEDRFFPKILVENLLRLHPFRKGLSFGFQDLSPLLKLGLPSSTISIRRAVYLQQPRGDPINVEAYRPINARAYRVSAYHKPALALRSLEAVLGEETVTKILRTLYSRFRFRHPTGEDFRALVSEAAGEDMSWFFDQVWDGTGLLDYAVTGIDAAREEGGRYRSEVTVRRLGDVIVPQTVRIRLRGGRQLDFRWDRRRTKENRTWMDGFRSRGKGVRYRLREGRGGEWLRITVLAARSVAWAQVDPQYGYLLDVDFANNSLRRRPNPALASRGELSWVRVMGRFLHGVSAYN